MTKLFWQKYTKSEPTLKDFVRIEVLKIKLLISSVQSVTKVSSIPQTTTYRIRTEHLLLKPYNLVNNYMRKMLLPLLTESTTFIFG